MRKFFYVGVFLIACLNVFFYFKFKIGLWNLVVVGPIILLGFRDILQNTQAIKSNFPVLGHFRYILEAIRPEINQYFVESNTDGKPFSREDRSIVYQRAKKVVDTLPFGTQKNVYLTGHEFVTHSLLPTKLDWKNLRVNIGGPDCLKPYDASIFNISAMSYGSLSKTAILALNGGAKTGGFAHNTGEGGLSPYHLENQGDVIWQIGTGYFGCRSKDGKFDAEKFKKLATGESVKMIEIKLSQGAKPGHGGILPGEKVTAEIAEIRGVEVGVDVNSPPAHNAFDTPIGLLNFVKELRDLSGGKPVGFKLCIGRHYEFFAICKAMIETGIKPDFIAVDGSEGGTGAAPLEFSNNMGTPTVEALLFVGNVLRGFDLKKDIKLFSAGRVTTGFGIVKLLSLGADSVYAARSMMLALGCIQALRCNTNHCPAGVATQNPQLYNGINVPNKIQRVKNFHNETVKSVSHIMEAMGVQNAAELKPYHIKRRTSDHLIEDYSDFFNWIEPGSFFTHPIPKTYEKAYLKSEASSFKRKDGFQKVG
jgi:glutamate synthase domain-containing protein 2